MKKLVSLALAAVLTLSSMSAMALSFGGSELPENVDIKLDTKIGQGTNYGDYKTESSALTISTKTASATINAQAKIDMADVADAWFDYIAAGNAYVFAGVGEIPDIVSMVDLSASRFTVKIVSDEAITNTGLTGSTTLSGWCTNAQTYFEQDGVASYTVDADTHKHIYTVTMKPKTGVTNAQFNEYFEGVRAVASDGVDNDGRYLTLTIENNVVAGDYNKAYKIESECTGNIVIGLPGFVAGTSSPSSFVVKFNGTDTNYVKLKNNSGSGGPSASTPAPTEEPTEEPTATPEPQLGGTQTGAKLNYDNHFAYIIGDDAKEDGSVEVRPQDNITRAEVATIFYRLLDDESYEKFSATENNFTDVNENDWFNDAVSTVAAAGIVDGYDDGTFAPDKAITRAEFATIASRFSTLTHDGNALFEDVAGHWAEDNINCAAVTGWVNGYDDGTFRPNDMITRAEAITLINRILYRLVDADGMLSEGYVEFVDNNANAWYYNAIVEASNSHEYTRENIGELETHTKLTENIDRDAYEK